MAVSVQMPALGESVTEGTVTRWLKQEGDTVEVDEPLLEVSTDKVDTEIPSPASGVLTKIIRSVTRSTISTGLSFLSMQFPCYQTSSCGVMVFPATPFQTVCEPRIDSGKIGQPLDRVEDDKDTYARSLTKRRHGRVAEGGGLLNRCRG